MRGTSFVNFDKKGLMKLHRLSTNSLVEGCFELWFPLIYIQSSRTVDQAIKRYSAGLNDSVDLTTCRVFFHEYLHLIQSVRFAACQLPILLTHFFIYGVHKTAKRRRRAGDKDLFPIRFGNEFYRYKKILVDIFGDSKNVILTDRTEYELTVNNVIEGAAKILEDKWYGSSSDSDDLLYSAIKDVNKVVLGEHALTDRSLLVVCEAALDTVRPVESFCRILDALSKKTSVAFGDDSIVDVVSEIVDQLNICRFPSYARVVIENTKTVFNADIFRHYRRHIVDLYGLLSEELPKDNTFLFIYDKLAMGRSTDCLPACLVEWIKASGSPVIEYSSGQMSQFDLRKNEVRKEDQNIAGIKAVVDSLCGSIDGCGLVRSCATAPKEESSARLHVDSLCDTNPWQKNPTDGNVCPYLAIIETWGVRGLNCHRLSSDDLRDGIRSDLLMHLTIGKVNKDSYIVEIRSNDGGYIPHFHVFDENSLGENFSTCIEIRSAKYFHHEGYKDEFNSKERKRFNAFMSELVDLGGRKITRWQWGVEEWNKNNSKMTVGAEVCRPDYRDLPNKKD